MAVTHSHPVKTIPAHDENDRAIYSRVFDLNDFVWLEKEYPLLPCILSEFDREVRQLEKTSLTIRLGFVM